MKRTLLGLGIIFLGSATVLSSCTKARGVSDKTGWNYNDSRLGGFDVQKFAGQQTGPGLVPVEGGRFTMGQTEEDLFYSRDNIPRTVSVSSFYMDETEVANVHYREYTYWVARMYQSDYPELVQAVLPDTTVWRSALSYNEPLVNYYFRYAGYNQYPVVGVSWHQANQYCKWRSDRVNEMILIKHGITNRNPNQINEDVFTTLTYMTEQYIGEEGKNMKNLDPNSSGSRPTDYSDGYLLPDFRLPTEAEWEFAARGDIANNPSPRTNRRRGEEAVTDRNNYPWGDRSTRYTSRGQSSGEIMGNHKRGRGDNMGVPGGLNDNADIPAPVYSYMPNAYGLYNMAGNVSEWVLDVYRPTALQDFNDFNPFVGNEFRAHEYEEPGILAERDSLGHIPTRMINETDLAGRYDRDYRSGDVRGVLEGDSTSLQRFTLDYGSSTTINNDSRVIKGGSWNDRAYYMSPGVRRHMQSNHASATVGFRCVMDRLGSPGFTDETGNHFSKQKRK